MSEWKNGKCVVYEDRHGNTRCGVCCAALFCDDNGDDAGYLPLLRRSARLQHLRPRRVSPPPDTLEPPHR